MFQSATLKLTAWYLAIIMAISIMFSVVIYQINYHELETRLHNFQQSVVEIAPGIFLRTPGFEFEKQLDAPRDTQTAEASLKLIWSLVWINLIVFVLGGLGSHWFARRTLAPIEKAHESQSRFTSDASHELRTPLAAMKTELEVSLRDSSLTKKEARELLESNLEEVNGLIALTEMLLKLSRLDSTSLDKEPVDLSDTVRLYVENMKQQKERVELTMRKKAPVYGNEAALHELVSILVDNALKYSPPGTPLSLRVFMQRGSIGLEVKNASKTIPKEHIERLFDRFYRVDQSRTHATTHSYGLGLSIAKKIVDLHGGTITVESKDETTAFTVLLPIHRKNSAKTHTDTLDSK